MPHAILLILRRYRTVLLYGLIGLSALGVELIVFYLFTHQNILGLAIANAAAMGAGFLVSFGLNSFYNFKVRNRLFNRMIRFGIVTAGGYIISTGIILGLVNLLHVPPFTAKIISIPFFFLFQYTLNSRFTFHEMSPVRPGKLADDSSQY